MPNIATVLGNLYTLDEPLRQHIAYTDKVVTEFCADITDKFDLFCRKTFEDDSDYTPSTTTECTIHRPYGLLRFKIVTYGQDEFTVFVDCIFVQDNIAGFLRYLVGASMLYKEDYRMVKTLAGVRVAAQNDDTPMSIYLDEHDQYLITFGNIQFVLALFYPATNNWTKDSLTVEDMKLRLDPRLSVVLSDDMIHFFKNFK